MSSQRFVTDKAAVLDQLERMISSAAFYKSKRCSRFLRHLVERTLEGGADEIKERTLGVDVFGRPAEYDNNSDPVVRMVASDIRKRIALYYHEPGREQEIRIELPLGSYVPVFLPPQVEPAGSGGDADGMPASGRAAPFRWRLALVALACVGSLVAAAALWQPMARPDAFERFWGPFLDGESPVTICLARALSPYTFASPEARLERPSLLAWQDSTTSTRVASVIAAKGRPYELRRDDNITLADLRQGPAVLIGAFNDVWTLRLTDDLRFEFQNEGSLGRIVDRTNASSQSWSTDFSDPFPTGHDYAVISRILESRTGGPLLTIAGLRAYGTGIAGEFVTSRAFLDEMDQMAPAGWQDRNLQVVIMTEVIDGHVGPPKIEALHVW